MIDLLKIPMYTCTLAEHFSKIETKLCVQNSLQIYDPEIEHNFICGRYD